MLVFVGLIHLLPLSGVVGAERLGSLYGVSFGEPNIQILMRHRAVLFGLLGVFMMFAAFRLTFRTVAFIAGFISVGSFLWLAWSVGGYNAEVSRVFAVDIAGLACLIIGGAAHIYNQRKV